MKVLPVQLKKSPTQPKKRVLGQGRAGRDIYEGGYIYYIYIYIYIHTHVHTHTKIIHKYIVILSIQIKD